MQIIVLGMHRSGTSTLARILNLMGCYFGSEDVSAGVAEDNPKGFWERIDVIDINDRILKSAGGAWWDVANLDLGSVKAEDERAFDKHIRNIVLKLDANRPWFIKDPRLCVTLPFWTRALERPLFIWVQRSPVAIARSLNKRDGLPIEYGLALWEFYVRSVFDTVKLGDMIVVQYEDLLRGPYAESERVYAELCRKGVTVGLRSPEREEIEAFVSPDLCHFENTIDRSLLSEEQLSLFDRLQAGRQPEGSESERRQCLEVLKDGRTRPWTKRFKVLPKRGKDALMVKAGEAEVARAEMQRTKGILQEQLEELTQTVERCRAENDVLRGRLKRLSSSRMLKWIGRLYQITGRGND